MLRAAPAISNLSYRDTSVGLHGSISKNKGPLKNMYIVFVNTTLIEQSNGMTFKAVLSTGNAKFGSWPF